MIESQVDAFRVACSSDAGLVQHKPFDTEDEAKAWAEENIGSFTRLVVEKRAEGEWIPTTIRTHNT